MFFKLVAILVGEHALRMHDGAMLINRGDAMKQVLTAVVPAIGGCNLKCAGCFIDQRDEANAIVMHNEDYLRFFADAFAMPEVAAFSIQGHEALLPSVYGLSRSLLQMSWEAKYVTSLVTNGVYLKEVAHEVVLITDGITVSVDSHDPVLHDLTRGQVGAWQKTIDGIKAVRDCFDANVEGQEVFTEYLTVASILYPNKVNRLLKMPELLASLGVTKWLINPLLSLSKGRYNDHDNLRIRDNILMLAEKGKAHGVEVALADEFRHMEHVEDLYRVLSVNTLDTDAVVTRLSPNASFSVGQEILSHESPRIWDRVQNPGEFFKKALAEYKAQFYI